MRFAKEHGLTIESVADMPIEWQARRDGMSDRDVKPEITPPASLRLAEREIAAVFLAARARERAIATVEAMVRRWSDALEWLRADVVYEEREEASE